MLRAAVTVGCAASLIAAAGVSVRFRHTRRTPSPLSGSERFGERFAVTVSRAGGMLTGAIVAGVLTVGTGGRLMMRLLAATSSDDAQGRLTEAEAIVGEVSIGGTLFLILGVGIFAGVVGLALFSVLRSWLPDRSMAAGLVGVAIAAGGLVRPSGLLASTNVDFTLLSPVALAVAMSLAMLLLFGTTFGVLVDHLAPRWPRPGWTRRGVASMLPFAVLLLSPPLFVAAAIGVLVGSTRTSWPDAPGHAARLGAGGTDARSGRILILALAAVGSISILTAAAQVLTI